MRFSYCLFIPICLLTVLAAGCGPMFIPMSARLNEDQKTVDGMWNNMLTPVNRVDRQTLLDTVLVYMMFQLGVDRLHLVTEKYLAHGKVVMEVDCDRANPLTDRFVVTVFDNRGQTVRRENYSRRDVEESAKGLTALPASVPMKVHGIAPIRPSTQPQTGPSATQSVVTTTEPAEPETPEERHTRLEYERRMSAVRAATQPVEVRIPQFHH